MKGKVVVGMSGGVDSSVAALLLKEQDYDVIGVTMQFFGEEGCGRVTQEKSACAAPEECGCFGLEGRSRAEQADPGRAEQAGGEARDGCGGTSVAEDAGRVAEILGIPHYVIDFREVFHREVVDYFTKEYLRGRTPNPCVVCNSRVKWEALLGWSRKIGADFIATGHYARIDLLDNGRYAVRNSVTAAKDQTYALYNLTQEQLRRTLMPVGEYEKERIREIARRAGLPVAQKPDSQEICFIPDDDYAGFIERTAKEETPGPGNFVTADGRILGQHRGITHYTVGQRRGLELPMGHRVFVTEIRPETNEVVIGENEELFVDRAVCNSLNFMTIEDLTSTRRVKAKIRYNHAGEFCTIEKIGEDLVECRFEGKVRAVTPGQAVVFYEGEHVLGGGILCRA